jgi:SAM-dependent methyltransferase
MTLARLSRRFLFTIKYLRIRLFEFALRPVQAVMRRRRMSAFVSHMNVVENATVLDLGGQPMIWSSVTPKLNITILNLPGIAHQQYTSHHNITYVEGDACNVVGYESKSFDIVFSNSVIEHVGDGIKQAEFAREVVRLGRSYWVQTPSRHFPIEAHSGMPFWWLYPERLRQYFIARWRRKLPAWTEMVEGTRVLDLSRLRVLFPDATMKTERLLAIPKSYVAYSVNSR